MKFRFNAYKNRKRAPFAGFLHALFAMLDAPFTRRNAESSFEAAVEAGQIVIPDSFDDFLRVQIRHQQLTRPLHPQ